MAENRGDPVLNIAAAVAVAIAAAFAAAMAAAGQGSSCAGSASCSTAVLLLSHAGLARPTNMHALTHAPPPAGACGRCYEVRCREGMLLGWDDEPIQIADSYYFPRWVGMGEGICW